ncbi:hypothetical protein [Gorillibacterium sp. CAU 1737]|uniref:hypothetical protein n=1 Tax=Gorillibacterium sp. CAU 1737 TaxID=3140362 RepID=UPI0032616100
MTLLYKLMNVGSGLPLVIYPFILIANVMSLAAPTNGQGGMLLFISRAFLILTTIYPISYFGCLILFYALKKQTLLVAGIPYLHLTLIAILFFLWQAAE